MRILFGLLLLGAVPLGAQDPQVMEVRTLEVGPGVSPAEARIAGEIIRNFLIENSDLDLVDPRQARTLEAEMNFTGQNRYEAELAQPDYIINGLIRGTGDSRVLVSLRLIEVKRSTALLAREAVLNKEKFVPELSAFTQGVQNEMLAMIYGNNLERVSTLLKMGAVDEASARLNLYALTHPDDPEIPNFRRQVGEKLAESREGDMDDTLRAKEWDEFDRLFPVVLAYDESGRWNDRIVTGMTSQIQGRKELLLAERKEFEDRAAQGGARQAEKDLEKRLQTSVNTAERPEFWEVRQTIRLKVGAEYTQLARQAFGASDLDKARYFVQLGLEYDPENPEALILVREIHDALTAADWARLEKESEGNPLDPSILPPRAVSLSSRLLFLDDPELNLYWKGSSGLYGAEFQLREKWLPPLLWYWTGGIGVSPGQAEYSEGDLNFSGEFLFIQGHGGVGVLGSFRRFEIQASLGLLAGGASVAQAGTLTLGETNRTGYIWGGLYQSLGGRFFLFREWSLGADLVFGQVLINNGTVTTQTQLGLSLGYIF